MDKNIENISLSLFAPKIEDKCNDNTGLNKTKEAEKGGRNLRQSFLKVCFKKQCGFHYSLIGMSAALGGGGRQWQP